MIGFVQVSGALPLPLVTGSRGHAALDAPEAAAARQGHSFMPCFLPEWEQHYRPSPCPVLSLVWWLHWGFWDRANSPAQGQPGSDAAGKLCPHCWLWPDPSATSSVLNRDPAPWQLCSGATEPSALPFWLSPSSAEPAPQVSASPVLSGSVQSMRQMLGTRAGAALAVRSSGGFCHLTRAIFLAKSNVLSHPSCPFSVGCFAWAEGREGLEI